MAVVCGIGAAFEVEITHVALLRCRHPFFGPMSIDLLCKEIDMGAESVAWGRARRAVTATADGPHLSEPNRQSAGDN